jgi:recombination protein RecA
LCELCGWHANAALTLASRLVLDAQIRGENAVWVSSRASSFFPPDTADCGIDLDALAVVRVPRARDIGKAADMLARSGAFGLVVLDLDSRSSVSLPLLARLSGLARKHQTAILFVTEKPGDRPSLGSLISLRADVRHEARYETCHEACRERRREGFRCELEVAKDKRRSHGWRHVEVRRGPAGLR